MKAMYGQRRLRFGAPAAVGNHVLEKLVEQLTVVARETAQVRGQTGVCSRRAGVLVQQLQPFRTGLCGI